MLIKNTRKAAEKIAEYSSCENITDIIDSITLDNSILVFVTDTDGNIIYCSDEYKGAHQKSDINDDSKNNDLSDKNTIKNKHILINSLEILWLYIIFVVIFVE